jgi:DNA-binding response OmpR family regulator
VLLVTEQPVLARMVMLAINHGPFRAQWAETAPEATTALRANGPDLAVVDADAAGGALLEQLRASMPTFADFPVIVLTRRDDLKTKLAAFDWGAVDILSVPFSPAELVARILVAMRRRHPAPLAFVPVVQVGDVEIDILNRTARVGERSLHLASPELSLLYLLAANAGRRLDLREIVDNLWGAEVADYNHAIDLHVRHLRAGFANDLQRPGYIVSKPGHGYSFDPVSTSGSSAPPLP